MHFFKCQIAERRKLLLSSVKNSAASIDDEQSVSTQVTQMSKILADHGVSKSEEVLNLDHGNGETSADYAHSSAFAALETQVLGVRGEFNIVKSGKSSSLVLLPSLGYSIEKFQEVDEWGTPSTALSETSTVDSLENKFEEEPAEAKPKPLAGTNVMNVILAAAECAPWSKTGIHDPFGQF